MKVVAAVVCGLTWGEISLLTLLDWYTCDQPCCLSSKKFIPSEQTLGKGVYTWMQTWAQAQGYTCAFL